MNNREYYRRKAAKRRARQELYNRHPAPRWFVLTFSWGVVLCAVTLFLFIAGMDYGGVLLYLILALLLIWL